MTQENYTNLAWEILYGDELEQIPDPNQPENTAHINALKKEKLEKLRVFINGVGAPLVDRWKQKIRSSNLAMLVNPAVEQCNCPSCLIIREIRGMLSLLIEAKQVLEE